MNAPGQPGAQLNGKILVQEPDNRNEFTFVQRLEERLGRAATAEYLLTYSISTTSEGVGITPQQETTRYNIVGKVDYVVTDRTSETVVHQGQVENFTGYSATSLIISTQAVTRDANDRLMTILADQIVNRLLATASDWTR